MDFEGKIVLVTGAVRREHWENFVKRRKEWQARQKQSKQ